MRSTFCESVIVLSVQWVKPSFLVIMNVYSSCTEYMLLYVVLLCFFLIFPVLNLSHLGRDSVVGIATRYDLDGPGIESRWGARFSAPVQTGPGACPASCTMGSGSFPGVKRPGGGVNHPPPSSAKVKERVELYLYSPSRPSWSVLGWTLPFTFTFTHLVHTLDDIS
jgi:hypothetical protein